MAIERGADGDMLRMFHMSRCYDVAPDENTRFLGSLSTHSPMFVL